MRMKQKKRPVLYTGRTMYWKRGWRTCSCGRSDWYCGFWHTITRGSWVRLVRSEVGLRWKSAPGAGEPPTTPLASSCARAGCNGHLDAADPDGPTKKFNVGVMNLCPRSASVVTFPLILFSSTLLLFWFSSYLYISRSLTLFFPTS